MNPDAVQGQQRPTAGERRRCRLIAESAPDQAQRGRPSEPLVKISHEDSDPAPWREEKRPQPLHLPPSFGRHEPEMGTDDVDGYAIPLKTDDQCTPRFPSRTTDVQPPDLLRHGAGKQGVAIPSAMFQQGRPRNRFGLRGPGDVGQNVVRRLRIIGDFLKTDYMGIHLLQYSGNPTSGCDSVNTHAAMDVIGGESNDHFKAMSRRPNPMRWCAFVCSSGVER